MNWGTTTAMTVCSYTHEETEAEVQVSNSHRRLKLEAPIMTLNSSCVSQDETIGRNCTCWMGCYATDYKNEIHPTLSQEHT